MFLSRKTYEDLREELIQVRERARVLEQQNTAWLTTCDWLRMRVNLIERERAHFIGLYTNTPVPVPEIAVEPKTKHGIPLDINQMNGFFSDIGDEQARQLGVDWNEDGTVRYTKPEAQ